MEFSSADERDAVDLSSSVMVIGDGHAVFVLDGRGGD